MLTSRVEVYCVFYETEVYDSRRGGLFLLFISSEAVDIMPTTRKMREKGAKRIILYIDGSSTMRKPRKVAAK